MLTRKRFALILTALAGLTVTAQAQKIVTAAKAVDAAQLVDEIETALPTLRGNVTCGGAAQQAWCSIPDNADSQQVRSVIEAHVKPPPPTRPNFATIDAEIEAADADLVAASTFAQLKASTRRYLMALRAYVRAHRTNRAP